MNSEKLHSEVISDKSSFRTLADSDKSPEDLATELYRRIYSRNPAPEETQLVRELLTAEGAVRRQVLEDLAWAMLNSAEFVIQD
jgi:hypothetical protein